jgi:hypothetical protein
MLRKFLTHFHPATRGAMLRTPVRGSLKLIEQFCRPASRIEAMEIIKRVIIFLIVTVGVFATVEFISIKVESADDWGVHMAALSSKDTTVKRTASVKTSHGPASQKNKMSNL